MELQKSNIAIGANIKKYRQLRNITQKQLAALIGKTESSVQKYEAGTTEIPRSVLEKIANVLGLQFFDLLAGESAMNWLDDKYNAVISLLDVYGCKIVVTYDDFDNSEIRYKGTSYIIPTDLLLTIITDVADNAIYSVEKFLKYFFANTNKD